MSSKFIDILFSIVMKLKWRYLLVLFVFFFFGSWGLMCYFEPHSTVVKPSIYWWYFVTDVLRGGYSGYTPTSVGGRLVSLFSFFGGGICFVATITKTAGYIYEHSQRHKKGVAHLNLKKHIVLLGYREGESDMLINQLIADPLKRPTIVLCSRRLKENPFPGMVEFVQGDTASEDALERSCISRADVVVINGHSTDERTMVVTVAANAIAPKGAHIVVYLESAENCRFFGLINPKIECVTSLRPMLLAQAVLNPGSTRIIGHLVNLQDPGNNYRIDVPDEVPEITFHLLLATFNLEYKAIVVGYAESHACDAPVHLNPKPDTRIKGGMSIFYIADHPVDKIVDWSILENVPMEGGEAVPV